MTQQCGVGFGFLRQIASEQARRDKSKGLGRSGGPFNPLDGPSRSLFSCCLLADTAAGLGIRRIHFLRHHPWFLQQPDCQSDIERPSAALFRWAPGLEPGFGSRCRPDVFVFDPCGSGRGRIDGRPGSRARIAPLGLGSRTVHGRPPFDYISRTLSPAPWRFCGALLRNAVVNPSPLAAT